MAAATWARRGQANEQLRAARSHAQPPPPPRAGSLRTFRAQAASLLIPSVAMLSRQDLTSPSRQDKNAGNSGDLVKHTAYLAMLDELVRSGRKAHVVEAHGGKGVYVSSHPHLRKAQRAARYSTSAPRRAEAEC